VLSELFKKTLAFFARLTLNGSGVSNLPKSDARRRF
jgi:hypothetical protein